MPFGQALARPAPANERELGNRQYAANYIPVPTLKPYTTTLSPHTLDKKS